MFFGKNLSKGVSYTIQSKDLKVFSLYNFALHQTTNNKPVSVNIEHNGKKFTICTLQKSIKEDFHSKMFFKIKDKNDKYVLSIDGEKDQKVSVVGCIEFEEGEDSKEIEIDEEEKKEAEKRNKKEEESEEEDQLSEQEASESLEELLKKKRLEAPQDTKPVTLKNNALKTSVTSNVSNKSNKTDKSNKSNKTSKSAQTFSKDTKPQNPKPLQKSYPQPNKFQQKKQIQNIKNQKPKK